MEPIEYPQITLLLIEQAKQTFQPSSLLLDPDWVTVVLFKYQQTPQYHPFSETFQDCVWGAEEIKPRSEWNITPEQAQQARDRLKEVWRQERAIRKQLWQK